MRTVAEVGVGLLFALGAVFNAAYTLRHAREFYGEFASGAWLKPAGSFVRNHIVPRGRAFTVVLIGFQVVVASSVLSRTDAVGIALVAGGIFALVVGFFSSPGGTVGNFALAAIQFALAATQ